MTDPASAIPTGIAQALRSPFVPTPFERLAQCGDYLARVWPQLEPSVETDGFRQSALYLADMALEAVEQELEPGHTREALSAAGLGADALASIVETLDVFQWVTPQALLLLAALTEAAEQPRVGGGGRADPRVTLPAETVHLATAITFAAPDVSPLPAIAAALELSEAPDLYRAVATLGREITPTYVEVAWSETQHLASFPGLRRRGRALYYYARSATRFLAYPLAADVEALAAAGLPREALECARGVLGEALPATATALMHCTALRVGLGLTTREVTIRP